ncbi:MAG: adenylosuccinate lyase [Bacteroidota bacterium]
MVLHTLSPLDGRYVEATGALRDYFSEFAYLRSRVRLEVRYLAVLASSGLARALTAAENTSLEDFTEDDALRIQEYEKTTRHDVKAIEYFLRERLGADLHPWIHFGLTSEDVNNLAQALALRDSRDRVLIPVLDELLRSLSDFAQAYRTAPMLARTHGQPAVPTTLGKEMAVFLSRLLKCRRRLADHRFEGKLTGAAGNLNALQAAAPHVDWLQLSSRFVESLGLEANPATAQILPYDNWIVYFQTLELTNSVLIGYTQDMWRYISDGYLRQAILQGEVGSSTMPQKVNPIDFENAEGNLGLANALFAHYAQKLPISRLQRDLSDSTVRRTLGEALGHTLLAWQNITAGMGRLAPDLDRMKADLNSHWETLSEGAQSILRLAGREDAYETLKSLARGRTLTEADFRRWVDSLGADDETLARLRALSPASYIGLAVQITDQILKEARQVTAQARRSTEAA